MSEPIDLSRLIDEQPIGRLHVTLVALCCLLTVADGYDLVSIAFAAPLIIREWNLGPAAMAPILGLGLSGGLIGPLLFGWLSDRYGRKTAATLGAISFGAFTLASVWAGSLQTMLILRLVAGVGLTGVLPTVVALLSEYAPRRVRARMTIFGYFGVTVGGALAGLLASQMMEAFGWRSIFWVGGGGPILIGAAIYLFLPESLKFLALAPGRRGELLAAVKRLNPAIDLPADAQFVLPDEPATQRRSLASLFEGDLSRITPLLWLTTMLNMSTLFFLTQWLPTLLTGQGFAVGQAAFLAALFQIGGIGGGLIIMRPVDLSGYRPMTLFFLLAAPVIAAIGIPQLSFAALAVLCAGAGFLLTGLQFGNVAAQGQVYPTAVRSLGLGSCFVVGRLGSILGPLAAGALIGRQTPLPVLFLIAAGVSVSGGLVAALLIPLYRRRVMAPTSAWSAQPGE